MKTLNNLKSMGVINITPNSFSDGNLVNSYSKFKSVFQEMLNWANIIDIGAESTAPFNNAIDSVDELERFENYLFPLLQELEDPRITLSIDTYKPEVFYEVYWVIKEFWPKTKIIFNDVSGKIDDELIQILCDTTLDFEYVFCHNLCPTRDLTLNHMDYLHKENGFSFIDILINHFKVALESLLLLDKKIWIDPCFGFSKTRAQNQFLLKNIHYFLEMFDSRIPMVYGISRKSFLRIPKELNAKDPKNQIVLDQMQTYFMVDLLKNPLSREFTFRVHNESSINSALNIIKILE